MIRGATRRALCLAIAGGCALALAWLAPGLPGSLQAALLLYALVAVARPIDALIVFAGLGPVMGGVQRLANSAHGGATLMEAMLLALLAGAAVQTATRKQRTELTHFEWALLAFGVIVAASCLAQWPVTALRAGIPAPVSMPALILLHRYWDRPVELTPVLQAVQLLEGAALAAAAARLATGDRALRLVGAVVVGAAGAAALNVQRLFEVTLRQPDVGEAFLESVRSLRISTQYGDANAAGSYFAMTTVIGLALTRNGLGRRALALASLPLLAAALWLAGSRVALTSTLLCGAWILARDIRATPLTVRRRRALMLAAGGVAIGGLIAVRLFNPDVTQARFGYSVFARVELLKTGLRMLRDRPLVGVGISRFYDLFPQYSSEALRQAFATSALVPVTHENAHNNLMQILAELGVTGFVAFTLILVTALWWSADAATQARRLPAIAGVAAFLLTCLGGHPLLTPMVAFPFWLVLGAGAAGAQPVGVPRQTHLRWAAACGALLLAVTLPVRAGYERREADLRGVSIGMSSWERDEEGIRFRAAKMRSAFFVASSGRFVRVPLRSPDLRPRRVAIRLDGRQVSEVAVPPGMWFEIRLVLPAARDAPRFRRIDLTVEPDAGSDAAGGDRAILVGLPSEESRQE